MARCAVVPIAAVLAIGTISGLHAQVSGGVFRGEVHDPSLAVIPNAKITVRSVRSGMEVPAESSRDGVYQTPTLPAGDYTLTASKGGFKNEVFGPVNLPVNQTVRVDFTLTVGSASESVTVSASGAQMVQPESAEMSQVIGSTQVSQMPLNGRNWQDLIGLSAGVISGPPNLSGSPNAYNINGQRDKGNQYMVDGVSVDPPLQGHTNGFAMPLDAIQEFTVQENGFSAEYGDVGGGVVNLQVKSGSNAFHGSAFEFFRNNVLNAGNFFANSTGQPPQELRYNQFGGSLGGPIRRNRTFFFGDYQGTRTLNGATLIATLPTAAQRSGDFSSQTAPIFNPFTSTPTQFPGNMIPASSISPPAAALMALLPQPNQFVNGRALTVNNYAVNRVTATNQDSYDVRVDNQFSDRNYLFVRDAFQNNFVQAPSVFGPPLGGTLGGAGTTRSRNQNVALGETYVSRPNLTSEFRLGLVRDATNLEQQNYGKDTAQQFGIPGINLGTPSSSGLPALEILGLFNLGDSIITPVRVTETHWDFSEKLSWIKGRHSIRIGGTYGYDRGSNFFLLAGRGLDIFTASSTASPTSGGGNALASFLVGVPSIIERDTFPGPVSPREPQYGMFVQDDIKASSRLTLNVGLRYDILPFISEEHNRLANFDPATGGMLLAGATTNSRLRNTDYKDFGPRIGLAYMLTQDGKTVLRSGYGIAYSDSVGAPGQLNLPLYNPPFYYLSTASQVFNGIPKYTLTTPPPPLIIPPASSPTGGLRYIPPNDRNPYSGTWNFGIQRALTRDMILEVAYVGTTGNRLLVVDNINAAPPGPAASPSSRQPYGPQIGAILAYENAAHSSYNGLQTKLERRFSHGLFFLASYTWSKSIDNQSNGSDSTSLAGQEPQNPLNLDAERGLSSFDRTQRFVLSPVWQLPFGRNRAFASRVPGVVDAIIGGWQLSAIYLAETGSPFTVTMNCSDINSTNTFSTNYCRPNLIGNPGIANPSRTEWFNPAAFKIPSPAAYGNEGRNALRTPGFQNLNLGLGKYVTITEHARLQFRGEFFNSFNNVQWGPPNNSIDSPGLGTITSEVSARVIQLGLRLEF